MFEKDNVENVNPESEQDEAVEAVKPEVESKITNEISAFRSEWEAVLDAKVQQMLGESTRMAQMTDQERANYATDRREADIAAREKKLVERELRAEAMEMLAQRGLPKALAEAIGYDSREVMLAALDNVERAFRQAVHASVEQRLRGVTPASGASAQGDPDQVNDAEYYRMNCAVH